MVLWKVFAGQIKSKNLERVYHTLKIFATFQTNSFIDWDKGISSVIFLAGCNFRCSWCHNFEIVLNPTKYVLDFHTIKDELIERKKWCDRVVISGGEPTCNDRLVAVAKDLKALGFKVKIDTNGSNPSVLGLLLKEKLVDCIAMDIKTSLDKERYSRCCGVEVDISKIDESINIITASGTEYHFRTTLVPEFVSKDDIENIRRRIPDVERHSLQKFIAPSFNGG